MTALTAGVCSKKAKIVTGNVARHLVPRLERIARKYAEDGAPHPWAMAANHCSEIFLDAKSDVIAEIERDLATGQAEKLSKAELAEAKELDDATPTPTGLRDRKSQMLVSRGGKMFERFVPYALSKSLADTPWAVWKDTNDISNILGVSKEALLDFTKRAFGQSFRVTLEADFIALRPDAPLSHPIVLMNCKTSAKERLHQATMWAILLQILRDPKLSAKFEIEVDDIALWKRCRYVGVIGDFAVEQPDLREEPLAVAQTGGWQFLKRSYHATTPLEPTRTGYRFQPLLQTAIRPIPQTESRGRSACQSLGENTECRCHETVQLRFVRSHSPTARRLWIGQCQSGGQGYLGGV
jgi:hypothetical protein